MVRGELIILVLWAAKQKPQPAPLDTKGLDEGEERRECGN